MTHNRFSRRSFLVGGAATASSLLRTTPARTQSPKTRIALVGTGIRGVNQWGRALVPDYTDVVEFVGLCDHNPGRLAYAKDYIGVDCSTYTSFAQMLDDAKPDKVIVTTMDSTHDEFIVAALRAGCDVISEKPMTTDELKCQRIIDAQRETGRNIRVTHNYRYTPHRTRIKQLIDGGRIGGVTSVDFHWYLDIYHGAAYFRRWHGKTRFSGSLFVHKACHHFDLLNWWIESEPETIYAQGALEHYGSNHPYRSTNCRACPHTAECDFFWDINEDAHLVKLYVENEKHDGYLRDGCVWSEDIDIYDKMGAQIRYANGVQVSYSCTTYSPYEGYRIAFNGTEGRLEAWIHERQPWSKPPQDELRVTDNFGETELIRIEHAAGGHGGGDPIMLDQLFRDPDGVDALRRRAGMRDGAMAALMGIGATKSVQTGQPIRIGDLTTLTPRRRRP